MDWSWLILVLSRMASSSPDDKWAMTLTRLDAVRAEAFSEADPTRLDDVYVAESAALREDRHTLQAFVSRGARVVDAELRVLSCRVVTTTTRRVRLAVVDQLQDSHVVWSDRATTTLPHDQPSRHVVTLDRTARGWRIADVTTGDGSADSGAER